MLYVSFHFELSSRRKKNVGTRLIHCFFLHLHLIQQLSLTPFPFHVDSLRRFKNLPRVDPHLSVGIWIFDTST